MRILLIKTSSLGDVIHNLPVATDLRSHFPGATIDWVVEEGFADIPRMHPAVAQVLPVALRRWRRALTATATWREMAAFRESLQRMDYDLVLDTQGLLKSAVIARLARGRTCGFAATSAREPLAARFYDSGFDVPRDIHAVVRNRRLGALAGGYIAESAPEYGIAVATAPTSGKATALLLTATSRDDKLWAEDNWIALGNALATRGLECLLPSGSEAEHLRASRIAAAIPGATALPATRLASLAARLAAARLVIGVDTGLVHLAAALGRPTVALFRASDPALTGVLAASPAVNLGRRGRPPDVGEVLATAESLL